MLTNSPLSGDLDVWVAVVVSVTIVIFLVDRKSLLPTGSAASTVVLDNGELLFLVVVTGAVSAAREGGRIGGVSGFATFPSDARRRGMGFSLYSLVGGGVNSVAPVRGREDTEGDRDFGVKVQVD
ncbi:MAG: hypothetical protein M1837_002936 [Sclerophora amabilis]|nr:MAG: hypothetical protein M1837_002936 [Sclerophora amabilis]